MDHDSCIRLPDEDLIEANLSFIAIYGPGDEKIGVISDVLGNGPAAVLVMDVGGFLGIGCKRLAVAAGELQFMRGADGQIHAVTQWTKDELTEMPHHEQPDSLAVPAA